MEIRDLRDFLPDISPRRGFSSLCSFCGPRSFPITACPLALMGKMTWANFHYILNYPLALTAFKNSFYLSVGSATVVMLLTSVIAWITVQSKLQGSTTG